MDRASALVLGDPGHQLRGDGQAPEQSPQRGNSSPSRNGETAVVCILTGPTQKLQGVSDAPNPGCGPSSLELYFPGVKDCSSNPEGPMLSPSPSDTQGRYSLAWSRAALNVILI